MPQSPRAVDHPGAGIAAVVLAATAFSWGFILVKAIDLAPAALAFWRITAGATLLGTIALVLRVPWPSTWGATCVAGAAFAAHQVLYIGATQLTAVAIVTTIGATKPLLVMFISRRTVGEAVPRPLIGFGVLALAGVALVVGGSLDASARSLEGDILAVINMLAFTAYFLAAKRARSDGAPTLTFTAGFLLCAVPFAAIGMLLLTGVRAPTSAADIGLLAILVCGPANGHLLLNWAHARTPAAIAALTLSFTPLLATIWAWAVLDEPLTWRHLAGIVAVAVAIEGARRVSARHARGSGE